MNQIFNISRESRTLFVLGMDEEVVAASLSAAYAQTVDKLGEDRGDSFGHDYLRKIAQLFVSVPRPDDPSFERLLRSIVRADEEGAAVARPSEADVELAQSLIEEQEPATAAAIAESASELYGAADRRLSEAAINEAARRERTSIFGSNAADVAEAERELLTHLARNPRALKHFDTAYRLQLHVANNSPGSQRSFSYGQLVALGKLVLLRQRWPDAASVLAKEQTLLQHLERASATDEIDPAPAKATLVYDAEIRELLSESDPAKRISSLPLGSFLHT